MCFSYEIRIRAYWHLGRLSLPKVPHLECLPHLSCSATEVLASDPIEVTIPYTVTSRLFPLFLVDGFSHSLTPR